MIDIDTSFAPGCFGRAMTFKPETAECKSCPYAQLCAPRSLERTAKFRAELGIVTPAAAPVAKVKTGSTALTPVVPKKVEDLLARIDRLGVKVGETIAKGENPFGKHSIGFMRVICHVLLQRRRVEWPLMRACLMKSLGWSKETAAAHATQAAQALAAMGIASYENGCLTLKGHA